MMAADLEDGEIEDGEIPDEETGASNTLITKKVFSQPGLNAPAKQTDVKSKSPKAKKVVSAVNNKHGDIEKENILEDDWASDVEKAIKAAMDSKTKSTDFKTINKIDSKFQKQNEEDDRKSKRKKRKKKHRDDDEDKKETKRHKGSHGMSKDMPETGLDIKHQHEDDDDEMVFVRGASPMLGMNYKSSSRIFSDDIYGFEEGAHFDDSYEDSDFEMQEHARARHGDEKEIRRNGQRMRRRGGLIGKRLRKDITANKTKRLGMKRSQFRSSMTIQESRQGLDSICMFYMQGKCQKGNDCPYSHNAYPPRKMELCKFYLMDCCAKKDKCLYMHSNFPCRYYHTGLKCYAGDNCKFSHGPLTDTLRSILLKHLETAPKEILGDFPRLSREGAVAMVYNKKSRENRENRKIPSLFEIEVPVPDELLSENKQPDQERRSTPMPDSENEDGPKVLLYQELTDSEDGQSWTKQNTKSRIKMESKIRDEERKFNRINQMSEVQTKSTRHSTPPSGLEISKKEHLETGIPHTLPKKQRELFLRIQQQQREATDSCRQNQSGEADGKGVAKHESNKKKTGIQVMKRRQASRMCSKTSLNSIKLAEIDISESVSRLLSSIRKQQNARTNLSPVTETSDSRILLNSAMSTQARDPRLVSRDPRNLGSSTSSSSVVSPHSYDSPRHDHDAKCSSCSDEPHRVSIYSTVVLHGHSDNGSDIDLRRFHSKQNQANTVFESGTDMDFRKNSTYMYKDTDLRADVDLRGVLGLPFKPVPMHTPATEIEASLTSHPPIAYKLIAISVRSDPRLRKFLKVSNCRNRPPSPPSVTRSDPRRRSTSLSSPRVQETPAEVIPHQAVLPAAVQSMPSATFLDPRHPKNPAPLSHSYFPSTPRYEDLEDGNSNGSDTDLRMLYNQPPIDMQHARDRTWANNQQFQTQRDQYQSFTAQL
ncbi:hypothetical protein L9F63_019281 [Diploptera punctata]|uniref:C3H1-type domain-containing protein n=1 Tax=Diploptera punctata TaxID=6984 RepID=A0AAD8EEK3_DIPPU|nr:hypothetical protein L9F63_019281 [Diploptera punctata]